MTKHRPPMVLVVGEEEAGQRLDRFLQRRFPGVSRGSIRRVLSQGQIRINSSAGKKGDRLAAGQRVHLEPASMDEHPVPQPELALSIITVTPAVVVVNKTPGPATHPLLPAERDTVANALVARYPECIRASPTPREAGFVHRLDWSTSGVLIAARSRAAYLKLRQLFSVGSATKEYLALVHGKLMERQTLDLPLQTMPGNRSRMQVAPRIDLGLDARSEVEPLAHFAASSLVRVRCNTGRRHQVRVHLASIGHTLVGDDLYGDPSSQTPKIHGAFLHASRVQLAEQSYTAELPAERVAMLRELGWR